MALAVTGFDASGRITPKGTNVVIPPQSAGIGDLIFGTRSDFQVIGRGTASGTYVNNRELFGVIYGFVAGMAMVAHTEDVSGKAWKSSGSAATTLPTFGSNPLMRNGKRYVRVQMNTAENATYITSSGALQPSDGLLTSAYQATPLTSSTYQGSANAATKQRFGTTAKSWTEYIRQTLRVNGAPGTCFGATATGVKVHEFGRWMTGQIGADSAYPAAYYCWTTFSNSKEGIAGAWWLPSMFELGELMIDEHRDRLVENSQVSLGLGPYRWSCVLYSASNAWLYDGTGTSNNASLSHTYLVVRPVTLFKLT